MTHARSSHTLRMATLLVVLAALAILLSACGLNNDAVDTVDSAVTLLQDLEDVGVWGVLDDNLDALDAYDGYQATVVQERGALDAEGNNSGAPDALTQITVITDAAGIAQITIDQDGQTRQIMAFPLDSDDDSSSDDPAYVIVEMSDAGYTCADQAAVDLFTDGPQSLFEAAGFKRAAQATLAVIAEDGDSTLIDRDATHYQFETRLGAALDILDSTENAALREQVEQAESVTLTGTLDLDNDTLVPLHFTGTYTDTNAQEWATLTFTVTQWGDVPAFERPADEALPICE